MPSQRPQSQHGYSTVLGGAAFEGSAQQQGGRMVDQPISQTVANVPVRERPFPAAVGSGIRTSDAEREQAP